MKQKILVTGGLGYIGSHTVVALYEAGYEPVIIDNCSNSSPGFLERIAKITGHTPAYYKDDVCDKEALKNIFEAHKIEGVIHFAAFKSVGESVEKPLKYYHNNINGLVSLLEVMKQVHCEMIVFSSSCSIYGNAKEQPVRETTPAEQAQSPYAHTKQVGEEILKAISVSEGIKVISLRYFNPIGAHSSALIGEAPIGVPSNLVPFITQTAAGIRKELVVHGDDYPTTDGTCIRDYIHVVDLARAHVIAMNRMLGKESESSYELFNLGTGTGSSVLECIRTFEKVSGVPLNYHIGPRREGDVVQVWADTTKANHVLKWKAEMNLEAMLRSAWNWQKSMNNSNA